MRNEAGGNRDEVKNEKREAELDLVSSARLEVVNRRVAALDFTQSQAVQAAKIDCHIIFLEGIGKEIRMATISFATDINPLFRAGDRKCANVAFRVSLRGIDEGQIDRLPRLELESSRFIKVERHGVLGGFFAVPQCRHLSKCRRDHRNLAISWDANSVRPRCLRLESTMGARK
jgi:hypothetical protein